MKIFSILSFLVQSTGEEIDAAIEEIIDIYREEASDAEAFFWTVSSLACPI